MILYFADRHLNILGQATSHLPQGVRLIYDLKSQDVETGVSVFEGDFGFDRNTRAQVEEWAEVGNYILKNTDNESEVYTIVDATVDTKKQRVSVYAEDDGLDLINDIAEAYEADQEYPISSYVERFASGAGWKIGINEVEGLTRKLKWDSEQTASARLISIAEAFGCEFSFSFEIKGLQIAKKFINIYEKRGKDIGIQLRLNKEIDSIVTTKSIAHLATALKARGSTPADSDSPITLLGYEYPDDGDFYVDGAVLKSQKALEKWRRFLWKDDDSQQSGGHITKNFSYDTTSQAVLCEKAIEELKKVCGMEVNYEVDIKRLPPNVKIGDRVNIIDDAGELYLSTRILKLESSETDHEYKATLGEHLLRGSGISQKVAELAAQFAINAQSAQKALEVANAAKESADAALEEAENAAGAVQDAVVAAGTAADAANKATESANQAAGAANAATEAVGRIEESVSGLQQTIENANQAAQNAAAAAQTATEKAGEAKTAAENAEKAAEEAAAANSEAQKKAAEAVEKAEEATENAGTAKAKAQEAAAISNAAKKDALQAEADIAEWETTLNTVTDTMSAEYSRKTDLTEATESLQSQISRNAGSIKQNVLGVTVIDETANNALTTIEAAQKAATLAQTQANEASAIATEAQTAANTAQAAAIAAQNEANTAKEAYETAKQVADEAAADLKAAEEDLATVAGRVDATEAEIAAAQKVVDDAQEAADTAKANAKNALSTATAAQEVANAAVDTATKAQLNADKAVNEANIAQQLANEAKGNVTAAQNKVTAAQATAATAKENADNLKAQAEAAQATADQAFLDATAAQVTADKAKEQADKAEEDLAAARNNLADVEADVEATAEALANAQADVAIAQEKASEAQTYATQAQAAANTAKTEATQAQQAADTAKAAADAAQAEAKAAQDEVDKALGIVYSLEKRVTTAETGIEQTKSEIRLFAKKDEVIETLGGYYTKEEADSAIEIQAEKVTTKVSRTYETKEDVKTKLNGYYTQSETDAQIDVKAGEITSTVSESFLTKEDYTQAQEEMTEKYSTVSQQAESLDIKFTAKMTEVDNEMHTKFSEMHKYFNFTANGIVIGGGENALSLSIDNEGGLVFAKNGVPFGWWDGTDFHTGNIVVSVNERAQFGDFAFVPRSSGSLSFLKVKGNNTGSLVHTHSYTVATTQAATCTEPGTRAYMCACGESYTEDIEALGHNYSPVVTPPTETAQGYTTYTCTRCGDSYVGNYTEPTGCQHVTATRKENAVPESCTTAGSYEQVTYCTKCDNVISRTTVTIPATGHHDNNGDGYCDTCGTVTGTFYTVSVNVDPTGGGTVTGAGSYLNGSTATLTAKANAGYKFVGWYNGTSEQSTNSTWSFTVNSIANITAKFVAEDLTITAGTTKTVSVAASGSNGVAESTVPISAFTLIKFVAPETGTYVFKSTGTSVSSQDTCGRLYNASKTTILVYNDDNNGAAFSFTYDCAAGVTYYLAVKFFSGSLSGEIDVLVEKQTTYYNVTLQASPSNGGSVSGGGSYEANTYTNIYAHANSGYTFTGWYENDTLISTSANHSLLVNADKTLTAKFAATANYTVTVQASPTNGGTVSGGGTGFKQGDGCDIAATPAAGWKFVRWQVTCNGSTETAEGEEYQSTRIQVLGNTTAVAVFEQVQTSTYTVTTLVEPSGAGTVTGGGSGFAIGDYTSLTATANSGYSFLHWRNGNGDTYTSNPLRIGVAGNHTYTAVFSEQSQGNEDGAYEMYIGVMYGRGTIISVKRNGVEVGNGAGNYRFNEGDLFTVTAAANEGYYLWKWCKNDSTTAASYANPYTFTATSDTTHIRHYTSVSPV